RGALEPDRAGETMGLRDATMDPVSAVLETFSLTKFFGMVRAAEDLSLRFQEGELVGIVGPNGSGKTTLLNVITGYVKPDRGRIRYQGRDITGLPPRAVADLGIARSFQMPQLYLSLTVLENLVLALAIRAGRAREFWAPLARVDRLDDARRILEQFGLEEHASHDAGQLPEGARKLLDGGLSILRSLSLEIPTGGIVGLVGRNGAGKTTTLRSIMGLVPVVSGSLVLDDRDLVRLQPFERGRLGIGYMPEDRRLIGSLTVKDNLLVPAWGQGRHDADERWTAVGGLLPELAPLARRLASTLSGGQQKLVALGRALSCAHRLLLLDEPMEGVSPALSSRMAEVVRAFQATKPGLAVLVAESDVNRVRPLPARSGFVA